MIDFRQLAVTGVVSPEMGEARIREVWPSVASSAGVAGLGKTLTRTILLAPLGWLLMAGAYFGKVMPFLARRYTLTNRRVMIRKGWKGVVHQEVALGKIDDVRLKADDNTDFFRAATLEIVSDGQTAMIMPGVPDPESFRQAILNTRNAWVPGMAKRWPFLAASAAK
ncbi:MAG: PH domain-containing protein [Planctomycetes bacterium]|nr:PH domain-containing protein [Planctomycetota bacterium]